MFDRGSYHRDVAVARTPDVLIAACNSTDPRRGRWLNATAAAMSPDERTRRAAIADLRQMGFAAHTADPQPAKPPRRWGWWHTQAMIGAVFAAAACSGFFDAQGRRLCEGPTAAGGRCRNPAGCSIDHKAIAPEGPTLITEAVKFPAGLTPERTAARVADWANAPNAGPHGAFRAGRVLAAADAGVLPSGGARSERLVSDIANFLKARPWGFTFDPADAYDPADDSGGPLSRDIGGVRQHHTRMGSRDGGCGLPRRRAHSQRLRPGSRRGSRRSLTFSTTVVAGWAAGAPATAQSRST